MAVMLGLGVAVFFTDWLNRRITPMYEAVAGVNYTGELDEARLQQALAVAQEANSELLLSNENVSIAADNEGNRVVFIATAGTTGDARQIAIGMRSAFNEMNPPQETLIGERLNQILQDLEAVEDSPTTTTTIEGTTSLSLEGEILAAQIEALRRRLEERSAEMALLDPDSDDERLEIEEDLASLAARIGDLEDRLASLATTPVGMTREEQLQAGAVDLYREGLVTEYQSLFVLLLGGVSPTNDELITVVNRTPARKPIILTGVLGGVAAALLAVLVLIGVDMSRRPIWSRADLTPILPSWMEFPPRRPGRPSGRPWYPHAPSGLRKQGVQAVRSGIEGAIEGKSVSVGIVDLGAGSEQVATLTADLGAALAASGRNILVVDADFGHPRRMPDFATDGARLSDVLTHPADDEEVLLSFIKEAVGEEAEVLPGLRVLPSGTMEGDPVDALAGPQFAALLRVTRPQFDTVLVAMPSLGHPATDALSQRLDFLLLVVRSGRTTIATLKDAERDLRTRRSTLLGAAVLVGDPIRSPHVRVAQKQARRKNNDRGSNNPARHLPGTPSLRSASRGRQPRTRVKADPKNGAEGSSDNGEPSGGRLPHPFARKAAKTSFAMADLGRGKLVGPRILIYHQVGTDLGREMEVAVNVFGRQLDWLQSHGEVVSLEAALVRLKEPDTERLYVLTFDDGYEDMYRNAYPLLLKRRLPFTLYLTTNPIETGVPLAPGALPLTWDQVREMRDSGLMTVGSHTHTHPDLRVLTSETINEELAISDRLIRGQTGALPRHFAYPKGYWSEQAEPLVKRRFITAVLGGGPPVTDATDPHRIHRIPVQRSDGMTFFRAKMKRGLRMEESVRRKVRKYDGAPDTRR